MTAREINPLPRWRGFNLVEMEHPGGQASFSEDDFRWIADWGFNYVRIPLCYLHWIDGDWYRLKESGLVRVDRAVELGRKYGLHVCLNFHRAPGYCVAPQPVEPFNLWKDREAEDAFCFHWETFTRRYQGIDSGALSFNLVNEPHWPDEAKMTRADHERVIRRVVAVIREIDAERLIIADGLQCANDPCPELADLGIGQSCRAYYPFGVSHYQAPWATWLNWAEVPPPAWPGGWHYGETWTRRDLEALYKPWAELVAQGIGVVCGEGGAYNKTPHDVFLRWFEDVLQILREAGIGWALWHFRGVFGVLDSGRNDITCEDWHGHQLDRDLLELLRRY